MAKETTIKISKDFRSFLLGKRINEEDYEATIKRLISIPKKNDVSSIPIENNRDSIPKIREIKSDREIKVLPIDPGMIIKHQQEYAN